MKVYVLNNDGRPLMPCKPAKTRKLLRDGKAKVVRKTPFTIKLLWDCENNTQEIVAGMDTGSKRIGVAAVGNDQVLYQSEVEIRDDVSRKMKQRTMYRRTRRSRKNRYRPARWLNRKNSTKLNRLPPSIKSKVQSHLREKKFVESILPISQWIVETASFDIHKISNPDVIDYQEGPQKDYYNTKTFVLDRDNYKCQHCKGKSNEKRLEVHHIVFRSNGGTDAPDNLITLCKCCHEGLHDGKFEIKGKPSKTKHATHISIIKSQLKKLWEFTETFGYLTKYVREKVLSLPKTHYNDGVAIATDNPEVQLSDTVYFKRHVSSGDYQQTKGNRSQIKIPTGKLFGMRKFDLIKTPKGIGFVKGKRSTGYFAISDIHGNVIHASANVKKNSKRIQARKTTLTERGSSILLHG